jgi:hypothetical protein
MPRGPQADAQPRASSAAVIAPRHALARAPRRSRSRGGCSAEPGGTRRNSAELGGTRRRSTRQSERREELLQRRLIRTGRHARHILNRVEIEAHLTGLVEDRHDLLMIC